jgi:hypothetical protein
VRTRVQALDSLSVRERFEGLPIDFATQAQTLADNASEMLHNICGALRGAENHQEELRTLSGLAWLYSDDDFVRRRLIKDNSD